eukprot:jgi/Chrzof1/11985/Cz06g17040.t1
MAIAALTSAIREANSRLSNAGLPQVELLQMKDQEVAAELGSVLRDACGKLVSTADHVCQLDAGLRSIVQFAANANSSLQQQLKLKINATLKREMIASTVIDIVLDSIDNHWVNDSSALDAVAAQLADQLPHIEAVRPTMDSCSGLLQSAMTACDNIHVALVSSLANI